MQEPPRRLRRIARPKIFGKPLHPGQGDPGWPALDAEAPHPFGVMLAILRLTLTVVWTLLAALIQAVCLLLPGPAKVLFARFYWRAICFLLGVRVRVLGLRRFARGARAHRVLFAANHQSWLDIAVLGGLLNGCFVAKDQIAGWPGINIVARLGRSIFVSRRAGRTGAEADQMRSRLLSGDNLILFPEGTSSDGSRVRAFRSTFFALAEGPAAPWVVPVAVAYDRLGSLPTGRADRPLFAWYGGMDLASHVWRIAQSRGMRATVWVHPPMNPAEYAGRKALAAAAHDIVDDAAASLRQNHPVRAIAKRRRFRRFRPAVA